LQGTSVEFQIKNVLPLQIREWSCCRRAATVEHLERIEVLEGPQGTLFGSGAEAGMLRYITNKPKLDVTEGNVNAGYSYTTHGDPVPFCLSATPAQRWIALVFAGWSQFI
jgi:hypothetical protein